MRKWSLVSLLVIATLVTQASVSAQPGATPTSPTVASPVLSPSPSAIVVFEEQVEQARARLSRILASEGVAGLAGAASVDGQIVWSEGFGWADVEHRVSMTPQTRLRVGSVAKPMTAVALGLLVEREALDLDAEIQRYVPNFPRKAHPITPRQVAGHIAGIRHYRDQEFLSSVRYETVDDALSVFAKDPLLFEPGTKYSYSSYGYNLLSAVIEGAADEDFLGFMEREVFDPLAMRNTTADDNRRIIPGRSRFYERVDGQLRNATYVDNSVKWAGGGFLSTAEDLVRFGAGLLDGRVLDPKTLVLLTTPLELQSDETSSYGIGFENWMLDEPRPDAPEWTRDFLERDKVGHLRFTGHTGGSMGGITAFVMVPQHRVVVALISNTSGIDRLGGMLLYTAIDLAGDIALSN